MGSARDVRPWCGSPRSATRPEPPCAGRWLIWNGSAEVPDELDTEIVVEDCDPASFFGAQGFKHLAYDAEYPEEGCHPLGDGGTSAPAEEPTAESGPPPQHPGLIAWQDTFMGYEVAVHRHGVGYRSYAGRIGDPDGRVGRSVYPSVREAVRGCFGLVHLGFTTAGRG